MKINNNIWGTNREILLGFVLFLAFILPHTSVLMTLVNPIMCVLLYATSKNKKVIHSTLFAISAIVLSLVVNIAGQVGGKSILTAATIILYLLTFPLVSGIKVKNIYLYIIFALIFLSQIGYMFNLSLVTTIVDTYYPISWNEDGINNMINSVDISNYSSFRLGGLYRNPNHCAKYVTFLLAIFLVNNSKQPIVKNVPYIVLCFICIILSGSRTGFIVGSALILFALFKNQQTSSFWRIVVTLIVLGVLLGQIFSGDSSSRGLAIEQGLQDSAGAKFNLTIWYLLNETSMIHLLFGHFDLMLFQSPHTYSLDCEYGYIIYCFGFAGFVAFAVMLWKFVKSVEKNDRFFFLILLWMITSSIFMSYRSVFAFMLMLSTIYPSMEKKKIV